MKKAASIIEKNLSGKKVLGLFIVTNLVYAFMLMVSIPRVMHFSNGMKLLDMMPLGYDSAYVKSLFDALGEKGRHAYLYNQLPADMVYPLLFAVSYSLLLAFFLKKAGWLKGIGYYMCFLPILAGMVDYLENFGIITLLNNYPNLSIRNVQFTALCSLVKSMATTLYFLVLITVLFKAGLRILKKP